MKVSPSIALVTSETRLKGLLAKWGTKGAAKFRLKSARVNYQNSAGAIALDAEADFDRYVEEDDRFQTAIGNVRRELEGLGYPVINVTKNYLPTYYFGMTEAVVVVGPDGLVANTAKYAGDLPIIGINPDPSNIDGVLLPFQIRDTRSIVRQTLSAIERGQAVSHKSITMAKATMVDGRTMLAFNDFFIGRQSHVSARYVLYADGKNESQSSSGILVATGAGSTGWLSSVYNMTRGIVGGAALGPSSVTMPWDTHELRWVVREPFLSRTSAVGLVTGTIGQGSPLRLESLMPEGGVVFSDGIEADYLEFNTGAIAEFGIAPNACRLVV
ncbi:NAD(+)/NADH kinase [Stieleria varia]|nr:hypothetical protein [Stieleria varia]